MAFNNALPVDLWMKMIDSEKKQQQEERMENVIEKLKATAKAMDNAPVNDRDRALENYYQELRNTAKDAGEYWEDDNDDRIDIIGQNGNDGLHYDN